MTHSLKKVDSSYIIALSAFIMFPLAVFGPLGYAVLFPFTAWSAFALKYFQDKDFAPFPQRILLLLLALQGWGVITVFWSLETYRTLTLSVSLLLLSASGIILWKVCQSFNKVQKDFILKGMTIGLFVGLVLLGFESITQGLLFKFINSEEPSAAILYKFNKATSIISILIWPIMMANYKKGKKLLALSLLTLSICIIFSLESDTSKGGLIVGALVFGLAYQFRRLTTLCAAGLFFALLVMPLLSQTIFKYDNLTQIFPIYFKNSLVHRFNVWEYVGTQIRKKPFFGWGLDTARSEQFSKDQVECKFRDSPTADYHLSTMPALLLHPHNAGLQWWLELGLVGILIVSFLVIQIPWSMRSWAHRGKRAAAFSSFITATLIAFISYGIWQNWWISTLWLAVIYGEMLLNNEVTNIALIVRQ